MPCDHRFKAWHIFDSALTKDAIGHHYWETKSLAEELTRSGKSVRIFSYRDAPATAQFPGAEIVPTFSLYLYTGVSNDPAWSVLENFVVQNRAFHNDLARLDISQFRDSIALFPTVGERQLLGLLRWLGAIPREIRPKTAVCLMPPRDWSRADPAARMYRRVWENCPPDLKAEIAIFSRTQQIADMFHTRIGMPSKVFPLVLPEHKHEPTLKSAEPAGDAIVVSYLGGSRREKGASLVPDVVKQCAGSKVEFRVQVQAGSDSRFDVKAHSDLAGLPHVRLLHGTLERDDFYAAMEGSVALLPYDPLSYRWQDSSIYHEAKLLDVPVLAMAGTCRRKENCPPCAKRPRESERSSAERKGLPAVSPRSQARSHVPATRRFKRPQSRRCRDQATIGHRQALATLGQA